MQKKQTMKPRSKKTVRAKNPGSGSKKTQMIQLLQRPDGVTLEELMTASGWQAHSVRGFLSATVSKKMGLKVKSSKSEDGNRVYKVA